MSIELILLAVNINLVAFSSFPRRHRRPGLRADRAHGRGGRGGDRACHPRRLFPQPRLDRGRRHQSDEGLSGMYEAIVVLPLLGAIIAGAIALFGARNRYPGEDPPPPRRSCRAAGRRGSCARRAFAARAHAVIQRPTARSTEHEPSAAGSLRRRTDHLDVPGDLLRAVLVRLLRRRLRRPRRPRRAVLVHHLRRPALGMGAAHRFADRGDAGRGDDGLVARPHLFDRLHGGGSLQAALLLLSVVLHLRHADAGDGRQSRAAVLRLGGRRASRATC